MARKSKKFTIMFNLMDWQFGAYTDLAVMNVYKFGPFTILVFKPLKDEA